MRNSITILLIAAAFSNCGKLFEPGQNGEENVTIGGTAFRMAKVLPNGTLVAPQFGQTKIMTTPQ